MRSAFWVVCLIFAAVLAVPSGAWGQSPYTGVYLGTFSRTNDNGQFGILVRTNGIATIAAYDAIDQNGFVNESVSINADGSFTKTNIDGEGKRSPRARRILRLVSMRQFMPFSTLWIVRSATRALRAS